MAPASPAPHDPPQWDDRSLASAELERLIDDRLARHMKQTVSLPSMTILGYRRDRAEVLARSDAPEHALLGFVLPNRFEAIGVFACSVVRRRQLRHDRDATLAVAATRGGQALTRIASPADGVTKASNPQGWVVDACLRAVGHATLPPDCHSVELPLSRWLDRLMVTILAADNGRSLDWSMAVELCPVPDRWKTHDPHRLGVTMGSTVPTWSAMRRSAAEGIAGPTPISKNTAAWMDDGMYARWCLGYFPDLVNLRADLEFLAPPIVVAHVDIALAAARSTAWGQSA